MKRWVFGLCIAGVVLAGAARADVRVEQVDPQLRLDLPGHTGEIRAIAFAAETSQLISAGRDKLAIAWNLAEAAAAPPAIRDRDIVRRRLRERVFRWQIARGPRGEIQALAASPAGEPPVIAVAGVGAMGSAGEILLVDARDGSWIKTLGGAAADRVVRNGHRQAVTALDFTADGSWLVSQDLDGQAFAWERAGGWRAVELVQREEERLGVDGARSLRRISPVRPLVAVGKDRVAVPVLMSPSDAEPPMWQVRIIELDRPAEPGQLLPFRHFGVITALAATPDGRWLVSTDLTGQVARFDLAGGEDSAQAPVVWEVSPVAESVAVTPDGSRVAVGVAAGERDGRSEPARLEVWDPQAVGGPQRVATRAVASAIRVLRASADGRWLAWSGGAGHSVIVEPVATLVRSEADGPPAGQRRLGGVGQRIGRVAFSTPQADARLLEQPPDGSPPGPRERNIVRRRQPSGGAAAATRPPRRIAVARGVAGAVAADQPPELNAAFDIEGLSESPVGDPGDWADPAGNPGGWTLAHAGEQPPGIDRWQLAVDGRPAGMIDLSENWQGWASDSGSAIAWIPRTPPAAGQAEDGNALNPWAVAIGARYGIFVFLLEKEAGKPCRLLRWFRGNENAIEAVAVSEDGRWLASGAADGVVMLWSLADLGDDALLTDRWGVSLQVDEAGRAVVATVDESGPLAGKDVRAGDVITRISFQAGKTEPRSEITAGPEIRTTLATLPWNTTVTFGVDRAGNRREFLRTPAWENVAAAYLDADDEWAFWTPRGYYAASANGDRLFGWLVNRGIDRLPRFFRANQFRRKLERPDVVSRILIEGSLDAALRAAGRAVPESSAIVLPQQIASAPEVRLIPPAAKPDGPAGRLVVAAEVDVPAGAEVDRVRFFGNGVPAVSPPRLVTEVAAADGESRRLRYEAELLLPEQDRHLVNVFAATRSGAADADDIKVTVEDLPLRTRDPRIFIITAGVDRYANAEQWQRSGLGFDDLRFAVKDAGSIRDALAKGRLGLYDQGADHFLADEQMTRSGWKHTVRSMLESIKSQIEPDDLLVLFLAGHGLTDVEAEGAYAYLCHDAALRVTAADDQVVPTGEGAIGWTDLAELADLPCRKFALVDTCHSGALGPAARSTTIREFQENMIVVLAAAADDQSSLESDDWGHGLFTKVLLEGLSGKADVRGGRPADQRASSQAAGLKDGIVSLDELIDYVRVHVPRIAGENDRVQTPTVSPVDLLDFVRPPLAKIAELP